MLRLRRRSLLLGSLASGVLTTLASLASADTLSGYAMDRFEPSERGSEWFSQDSLDMRGDIRPAVGVVGTWSYLPQQLHDAAGNHVALVENSFALHVGASIALFQRIRLGLDLPILPYQNGSNVTYGGTAYKAPSGASVGDLRIALDARILGNPGEAFRMGIGARVFAPTGQVGQYTSDGKARVAPHLTFAGDAGDFAWSASVGYLARFAEGSFGSGKIGSELQLGAGIGMRLLDRKLLLGPELALSMPVTQGGGAVLSEFSTVAWGLLGAHYQAGDFLIGAAAGPGLSKAEGNAAFRGMLSLEWAPPASAPAPAPVADRDHDGVPDASDACPDTAGVASSDPTKNGCPPDRDGDGVVDASDACPDVAGVATSDPKTNGCPPDRDGDGIADVNDACPDVAGVASSDPKKNGCPPDRDGDGVADANDACPDVAGVPSSDPKKNGCPSDRDGDGIIDAEDACPDHAGPRDPDPKKNGCPVVKMTAGRLEILEQIQFKTASAVILPESMPIVLEVAKVMKDHPEITKVRVEGHTDNRGNAAMNKDLSRRRAASVVAALVKAGIAKERLTSEGWGQEKPLVANDTDDNRQKNRRVEFHIVASAKK